MYGLDILEPLKTPFVHERNGRKILTRMESWGLIDYDYSTDQFSAVVRANGQSILPRAPLGLYWLVTAPCNLRCIHCYGNVEELPRGNLTEQQQDFVAEQIINSGAMRVTLNGGEPLLRKDTPRIIEKLADHNIAVILGTNGTYLSKSIVNSVKRTSMVEISFDSHDEHTNNSIRPSRVAGGSAHKEALSAIELCAAENINFRVLTCVNLRNQHHIGQIAELLYSRGVRNWSISSTLFAGRARFVYEDLVVKNWSMIENEIERVREKFPAMKIKSSNRTDSSTNNKYSCLVFPNGRMFAEDLVLGQKTAYHSLLEAPLAQSWNTNNYNIEQHFARWTGGRVHFQKSKEVEHVYG